jgi:hypothetical protein
MKEVKGDLWTFQFDDTWLSSYIHCITTNGFVKKNGEAVMGRGCALEACQKYPGLAKRLGAELNKKGNTIIWLTTGLITFPVKHNWWEKADLDLIKKSADCLAKEADNLRQKWFILPRPGCGNGQRTWEEVKPLLENLPDNVLVIDFDSK